MRAHLVQLDITWEDRQANFQAVDRLLARADIQEGDLVVLPELFDSGFSLNTAATTDRDGATATYLKDLAEDLGATVQGGRTVRACTQTECMATNRMTAFTPDGTLLADYAKVHPFSFGREGEAFEGGSTVDTYTWRSGDQTAVVCPAVCYDLRFPELFRLAFLAGAEVFALGANWPDARQHHWRALLIARAIENQAIVLGVNRTGPDPHLNYVGGTIAVGPTGDVLGELGPEEAVLSVDIDLSAVRNWRKTFPARQDIKLIKP